VSSGSNGHSPGAIQIVDLYHARQHLWEVAAQLFPNDPPQQKAMDELDPAQSVPSWCVVLVWGRMSAGTSDGLLVRIGADRIATVALFERDVIQGASV
jgi:hypothetical protein